MTIGDANDVNEVLIALLFMRDNPGRGLTGADADAVCAASIRMADRAHKALMAGIDSDTIRRRWPKPPEWVGPR